MLLKRRKKAKNFDCPALKDSQQCQLSSVNTNLLAALLTSDRRNAVSCSQLLLLVVMVMVMVVVWVVDDG